MTGKDARIPVCSCSTADEHRRKVSLRFREICPDDIAQYVPCEPVSLSEAELLWGRAIARSLGRR